MVEYNEAWVRGEIATQKRYWYQRNQKFREWYEILVMIDQLAAKGMESYASNEPQTFYNMAHYLLSKGELVHSTPIASEAAIELDRHARVDRACRYMWGKIDNERQLGGGQPFIDELSFFLLVLGWYSVVLAFEKDTGFLKAQIWNPYDVFPKYANNSLYSCVHSYKVPEEEAAIKAEANGWNYQARSFPQGEVSIDDFFLNYGGVMQNMILIDSKDVTGWVERPEMRLLVAPVGGFPDRGSLTSNKRDWKRLYGRSIFAVNEAIGEYFNKWKSMISQVLRDTAQSIMQEFSASPQATPEQLRERGALFHYSPGEAGLQRLPPGGIPIEVQAHLLELRRELQKGSFNDAVYGMVEGQPGYALSQLATSSANQILYPFMDGKHFVIGESDRFWLSNLKTSRRVFEVKGKFIEKLQPTDIPEDVTIMVESEVAVSKDWLERGTIGGMLRGDIDKATLLSEVYKFSDPQAILRRKSLDRVLDHPVSQTVEMIAGYYVHADYLEQRGDRRQAALFRKAAIALEGQLGMPEAGQAKPTEMTEVTAAREAGTPVERPAIASRVSPPEATAGFTSQQLRTLVGRGKIAR